MVVGTSFREVLRNRQVVGSYPTGGSEATNDHMKLEFNRSYGYRL